MNERKVKAGDQMKQLPLNCAKTSASQDQRVQLQIFNGIQKFLSYITPVQFYHNVNLQNHNLNNNRKRRTWAKAKLRIYKETERERVK